MNRTIGRFWTLVVMAAFSCQSGLHEGPVAKEATKADTLNFPLRSVKIAHDGDDVILLLPFTRMISSDSKKVITVLGIYKGKKIGFKVWMPFESARGFILISMGDPSDNFLQFFQDVYGIERDKISHFALMVEADCLSMGKVADQAGDDSSGKHGMIDGYKVFFDSDSPTLSSECYFNISQKDDWIELSEEPDERQKILAALSRN